MTAEVVVSYSAKEQVRRLSRRQQAKLMRVLNEPDTLETAKQVGEGGSSGFISRFAPDMRVYWRKSEDGRIYVLSVVQHSTQDA